MLTQCPECKLQISDKAITCPHCGYPLKPDVIRTRPYTKSNKRKRLPNGFGQISQIKGKNLRNPYRAMVTIGKDPDTGKPISRLLQPNAYFATYNDAYAALLEYNRKPGSQPIKNEENSITVAELFEEWSKWYYPVLSKSAIENHTTAWNASKMLYSIPVNKLKAKNIRNCIDSVRAVTTKHRIKTLFTLMLDYAVEHEYCDNNVAKLIKLDPVVSKELNTVKTPHIAFTEDELNIMWNRMPDVRFVDYMLIQCYMGLRPRELLGILVENVDLENWTIKCGMKTDAGKNRIIPIHSAIRDLVKMKYKVANKLESPYLFNNIMSKGMSYTTYNKYFTEAIAEMGLNPEHRPHDPRKNFITLAKKYNVDEYAIKRIVGHAIDDITEKVYTERGIDWLKEEMEKIKGKALVG